MAPGSRSAIANSTGAAYAAIPMDLTGGEWGLVVAILIMIVAVPNVEAGLLWTARLFQKKPGE